ncbi:hypothetical protein ACWDA3_57000 [Nonomuraea rubra]
MTPTTLAETMRGNIVTGGNIQSLVQNLYAATRPVAAFIRDFDLTVHGGFVGRERVFTELEDFASTQTRGFFEIVGGAGLGKTALAVEIARRRDAITFLASVAGGATHPEQFLAHACASLIARYDLSYESLPERAEHDPEFLRRLMRAAVEESKAPVWIVVDALDEAQTPPTGANPLLLPPNPPDQVYLVVTRRAGDLIPVPGVPRRRHVLAHDEPGQRHDIERLIQARLGARATPALMRQLTEAADGNFMYLSFVLGDLTAGELKSVERLPDGLAGYYRQFWEGMTAIRERDWALWKALHEPVAKRLAVAFEPVTTAWLADQVGKPADEVQFQVLDRWSRLLDQGRRGAKPTWRTIHQTFAEYLHGELDLHSAHRSVAESYLGKQPYSAWDDYGMRHAMAHLARAAQTSGDPDHDLVVQLVETITNQTYAEAHLTRFGDPALLQADLDRAHRLSAKDSHPDATFLLVLVVLAAMHLRRSAVKGKSVLVQAHRGDLAQAERLLEVFSAELTPDWFETIRALIAWIGAQADPQGSLRLLERVESAAAFHADNNDVTDVFTRPNPLGRLVHRARGAIVSPSRRFPGSPALMDTEQMITRLAGGAATSLLAAELMEEGGYLSELDGPELVALAMADPAAGDRQLGRYVDVHRAYGYRAYRDRSLWHLLDAVLMHPDPAWVQRWSQELAEVVLAAPTRGEYLEGLEIAVLALLARSGDAAGRNALDRHVEKAQFEAEGLPEAPGRGEGDVWSLLRRRLAALAEAAMGIPDARETAIRMAWQALSIQGGFAGFTAPAALTLAETASLVLPAHPEVIEDQLDRAETAAHNIQDPTFCVRTTARVRAMREWWRPGATKVSAMAGWLLNSPERPEFAALHVVGEPYPRRMPGGVPLPDEAVRAGTLASLAVLYRRPVEEFVRLNPGHDLNQDLPEGTTVRVPDPGLPPLIAARVAAEVMARIPEHDRESLLRHLVPATALDITARCTVLARLLLSSGTGDLELLHEMRRLTTAMLP